MKRMYYKLTYILKNTYLYKKKLFLQFKDLETP